MMKMFSIGTYGAARRTLRDTPADRENWILDPLSHPYVDAMTERELGDLPFNRGYRGATECAGDCRCA
jgi:hypothetical protein